MPASRRKQPAAPFPSRQQIIEFIRESGGKAGKREIARAFRLLGEQKTALKRILRELEAEGVVSRGRGRRYGEPGALPPVAVIEVTGTDTDGEALVKPLVWDEEEPPPTIYVAPERRVRGAHGRAALGPGDRALARLARIDGGAYEARIMRRLHAAPSRVLGVLQRSDDGVRIKPVDRRAKEELVVGPGDDEGARLGDLVWAEVAPGRRLGLRRARVIERLGHAHGPQAISLMTIHDHDIPTRFPDDAWRQAQAAGPAGTSGREDLRSVPLVTIDGADARDFDDAVWAEPDPDPANPEGWHLLVAIADVAWYVRPGDPLDRAAFERGNSVYFPDRVVPMLPEALSNGWCSLVPGEDRPCLAAHLWIDREGHLRRHRFVRGIMRSAARLTYEQVQAARDGRPDDATAPLMETVIAPLYGAYAVLAEARRGRGVLELDLPERRVEIGDDGVPVRITMRDRWDSHRLIEEFMIAANVAAAEALEARKVPALYRVHDQPSLDKLEALRQFLDTLDLKLSRAQVVRAGHFNQILGRTAGTPQAHLVHHLVLRTQAQAAYDPTNIGHFGLALRRYCHFTSPIRRYSDLVVHRALISAYDLGKDGFVDEPPDLARVGEHLSVTERRADTAERDAVDRFTAAYLAERVGAVFAGRIGGVTRFGLFVTLDETGADGLVPISTLPDDYYVHDEARHSLVGRDSGTTFRLGDAVEVLLAEADPIIGGMILQLMDAGAARRRGKPAPKGAARRRTAEKRQPRAKPPTRKRR